MFNNILKLISIQLTRLLYINYILLILSILICTIGLCLLYSAGGGSMDPWGSKQLIRFLIAIGIYMFVSLVSIKFWIGSSYYIYIFSLFLLILVNFYGNTGMGSQRWLNLGFFNLQPSELVKFSLVLVLARYFHSERDTNFLINCKNFIYSLFLILLPAYVIFLQPDLGSSLILVIASFSILFVVGLSIWFFIGSAIIISILAPLLWIFFLYDYQKNRVLTFLDPLRDPLGSGYHIIQSKIALGSGGLFGKGFLQGTQSHLNFLPEKQTDFVFTMLAEEFGLMGGLTVIILFMGIISYGYIISFFIQSQFGRLLTLGMTATIFLYVFINIGMVMGIVPIVGVPLPFVSYGGTALLASMSAIGFIINCYVHRNLKISRFSAGLD